jgi:hypothetical protein
VRGDPALIEAEKYGLGLDTANGEAGDVGESMIGIGVTQDCHVIDVAGNVRDSPDEAASPVLLAFETKRIENTGHCSESEDCDEWLESGSSSSFLVAAMKKRFESEAASNDQHACSARGTESMSTERQQISTDAAEIDGYLANGV